ncbi:MAG: YebC/PmpR family DNA-binding transcriptional regulator [Parcubacteria group bacterium]
MSGHSKWSQIKRQKGAKDARRSNIFAKLGKAISIAAHGGKDPIDNFKLRMMIDKARQVNMPNDTIERAIKRGSGELEGATIEEITYEGYGPEGVALLIHTLTDNKNRTVADLRHLLTEHGGSLGNTGSVSWQFSPKSVIRIMRQDLTTPDTSNLQLKFIDAGAEDVRDEEDGLTMIADPKSLEALQRISAAIKVEPASSGIEMIPTVPIKLTESQKERLHKLIEILEEHDDVAGVYTNADI